ncbi:MAG: hypothetical protein K6T31_01920 [Alicyclobacillus sp.]|nr:hypothetical protein [Alicyclobacillus sp.]
MDILRTLAEDVGLTDPDQWEDEAQVWRKKAIAAIHEARQMLEATMPVGSFMLGGWKYYIVTRPPESKGIQTEGGDDQ